MSPIALDTLDATLSRRDATDRVARIASIARGNGDTDRGQTEALHLLDRARAIDDTILVDELLAGAELFGWPALIEPDLTTSPGPTA
ncbi:MAG: hypothetical protein WA931_09865 [Rhodococcus sp. (in: high G+C Gram-positive bacteria)]